MGLNESYQNVNNFLDGREFNFTTIFDDIRAVLPLNDAFVQQKIFDLYQKRRTQTIKLMELLSNSNDSEYDRIMFFKYFPFRDSRNPQVEAVLFDWNITPDFYFFYNFIKTIMDFVENKPFNYEDVLKRLSGYVLWDNVDLTHFSTDYKLGKNPQNKYPDDIEAIGENMWSAYQNRYKSNIEFPNYCTYVGQYAEFVAFQQICENKKPEEEVIWVSKDIGDGFGYDILKIDHISKRVYLYEVKGTLMDDENEPDNTVVKLSRNEMKIFRKYPRDYHIYCVCIHLEESRLYEYYAEGGKYKLRRLGESTEYEVDNYIHNDGGATLYKQNG